MCVRAVCRPFLFRLVEYFTKGKYLRCSDANNFISCMASPTKTIGNDRCGRLGNPVRVRSFTRCCMCRSLYSWSDPVTGETWEGGIQTQEQIASQCTSQKTSHDRDWRALLRWSEGQKLGARIYGRIGIIWCWWGFLFLPERFGAVLWPGRPGWTREDRWESGTDALLCSTQGSAIMPLLKVRRRQSVRSQETYDTAKGFVDAKNPGWSHQRILTGAVCPFGGGKWIWAIRKK